MSSFLISRFQNNLQLRKNYEIVSFFVHRISIGDYALHVKETAKTRFGPLKVNGELRQELSQLKH